MDEAGRQGGGRLARLVAAGPLRSHLALLRALTGARLALLDLEGASLLDTSDSGEPAERCDLRSIVDEIRQSGALEQRCTHGLRALARELAAGGEAVGVAVVCDFLYPGDSAGRAGVRARRQGEPPVARISLEPARRLLDHLQLLVEEAWRWEESGRAADPAPIRERFPVEKLVNSIADPLFVKDREHRWIFLNDAFCTFMGYSRQELIGRSDYDFFPREEADVFWAKDELVFQSGQENLNEERLTDAQGVTHIIQTKKSLYQDQGGSRYIVGLIRDVTTRKSTEDALIRSQQLAAVGTLAAGIAHEFNNINTSVIGNLQFLLGNFQLPPEARLLAERAVRAAGRAADITSRMLGFANPGSGERRVAELGAIARTTLGLIESEFASEGINLSVEISEPSPLVLVDAAQIGQVLMNLLINARHALLGRPERRIGVSAGQVGRRAFLRVEDTGCGIDPRQLSKIFLPFFSGKGEHTQDPVQSAVRGSGLGLSISDTITRNHGGEITVQTEQGRGSTFTVWLPAEDRPLRSGRPASEPGGPTRAPVCSRRILVLEDEPDVRELLREVLTRWGHQVVCSDDGGWALAEHARNRFEVALVDLQMAPMSGFEFLSRLGEDRPAVVVITGRLQAGLAEEVRRRGAELLRKPFDLAELRRTLERVLAGG